MTTDLPGRGTGDDALVTTASPLFADSATDRRIPTRWVVSWALWDWGGAAFNAVITTFVFTVYLTSSLFVDPAVVAARNAETGTSGPAHTAYDAAVAVLSSGLAWGVGIAGIVVALLAPVLGQRTDGSGRRKLWLGVNTGVVVVVTALMFFVVGEPAYFLLGVALVAIGTVFYEIATVNYNAMLVQVSTPKTVGRVSGFGWGAGYLGGIVLLLIVYFGIVTSNGDGTGGLLHVPTADGLNIRIIALIAAAWTLDLLAPGALRGARDPAERAHAAGRILRVVRRARPRHRPALEGEPEHGAVPHRVGAVPRRAGGRVHVRRHPGPGHLRLHQRPGDHLRDRRQRRRRGQHAALRTARRPLRAEGRSS